MKEATENMNGTAVTPVSGNLFEVNKVARRLNEEDSEYFHRMTVRLLFANKRA